MQKHYYDNVGILESVAKSPNHFVYDLVLLSHKKTVFIMDKLFQSNSGRKPESNSIKHRFAKVCGKGLIEYSGTLLIWSPMAPKNLVD